MYTLSLIAQKLKIIRTLQINLDDTLFSLLHSAGI